MLVIIFEQYTKFKYEWMVAQFSNAYFSIAYANFSMLKYAKVGIVYR